MVSLDPKNSLSARSLQVTKPKFNTRYFVSGTESLVPFLHTGMHPTNAHERTDQCICVFYLPYKFQKNTIKYISTAEIIM